MSKPRIVFVTGNENKLKQVKAIVGDTIELISKSLEVPEIQGTLEEIAMDKCKLAAEELQCAVLTEDTALGFGAWGGLPGPYIKWFLKNLGVENLHKLLSGFEDKSAYQVVTFAYSRGPSYDPILFEGRTDGKLVPARGNDGFGWNAAFEYEGKTYAELPLEEKIRVGARGKALRKFLDWLADQPPVYEP